MNAELEALIRSLDALLNAGPGPEAEKWEAVFDSQIGEVLKRHPGLSRVSLLHAVDRAHNRWLKADKRFPTLPPRA
jgi:hypothetical protein